MAPSTILPQRDIIRDAETGDYRLLLDGELVGFSRTFHEGETTLDELVYARLARRPLTEAESLAAELVELHPGLHFAQALDLAHRKLDKVMDFAAEYDALVSVLAAEWQQEAA